MSKKYIYVASGCGFLRMPGKIYTENPKNREFLYDCFDLVRNKIDKHEFGILYNAFVEKNFGEKFEKFYRKKVYGVYADSGGLQAVTLGKEITKEFKTEIFTNQSKYSDYGMCFDDIPVTSTGDTSKRGAELSTRYFDKNKLVECAKETGRGIQEQIDIFKQNPERGTKPFIILQGNNEETYTTWIDNLLGEIKPNDVELLDSVAIGAAALGQGKREDIDKIYYFNLVKDKINVENVHFLALGTISRMIPVISTCETFLKDYNISYDSTTHTMAPHFGTYYGEDCQTFKKLGVEITEDKKVIYEDIKKNIPFYNHTFEQFFEDLNNTTILPEHDHNVIIKTYTAFIFSCIINFQKTFEKLRTDQKFFENTNGKYAMIYNTLRDIEDTQDFKEWRESIGNTSLPSKRIKSHKPFSFGELI